MPVNIRRDRVARFIDPLIGHPIQKSQEIARITEEQQQLSIAHERLSIEHDRLTQENVNLALHRETASAERMRIIDRYLCQVQNCLTGSIYEDPPLGALGQKTFDAELREYGWDWPSVAHTMIGKKRLSNVRSLAESVLGNGVPGDFIETGVWRGGACILMRAVLDAYGITDRRVWLADSFEGLPPPDAVRYPADNGDTFHTFKELAVSIEEVESNFRKYDLLDDQVRFLKGWFKDTLPNAPVERLALLRLDGDMYESTMTALEYLFPRLSVGGYTIVDDYHVVPACRQAVEDYCQLRGIAPDIQEIDGVGVFWQKTRELESS